MILGLTFLALSVGWAILADIEHLKQLEKD